MWPENWPVVELFLRLATQWRTGINGATGLDYTAAYPLIDRVASSSDEWWHLFDDLQHLERAALRAAKEES